MYRQGRSQHGEAAPAGDHQQGRSHRRFMIRSADTRCLITANGHCTVRLAKWRLEAILPKWWTCTERPTSSVTMLKLPGEILLQEGH